MSDAPKIHVATDDELLEHLRNGTDPYADLPHDLDGLLEGSRRHVRIQGGLAMMSAFKVRTLTPEEVAALPPETEIHEIPPRGERVTRPIEIKRTK